MKHLSTAAVIASLIAGGAALPLTTHAQCPFDWKPGGGLATLDDQVYATAVYNGRLIAGGTFTTAGGSTVNHIAQWNGSSWSPLGSGMNNEVWALTVYNGALIAGGIFTTAGG